MNVRNFKGMGQSDLVVKVGEKEREVRDGVHVLGLATG